MSTSDRELRDPSPPVEQMDELILHCADQVGMALRAVRTEPDISEQNEPAPEEQTEEETLHRADASPSRGRQLGLLGK